MAHPELLVLAGLSAPAVEAAVDRIRDLDPDVAVLHHDLRDVADGRVHRRERRRGSDVTTTIALAHGCVSCTLREDLLPRVRALAAQGGRIVLHLDPVLEPEQVCFALRHVLVDGAPVTDDVDLRGVVTVVDEVQEALDVVAALPEVDGFARAAGADAFVTLAGCEDYAGRPESARA
ncbi:MAG: hypothetical protein NTW05_24755, partial [Pseudonocardiales bacterium]|nr:hypothetical protein [Pseudonocardiales bacterium]